MNTEIIKEKQSKKTESNILEETIINYSKHEINNFKNGKVKIAKNAKDVYRFIEISQKYPSNAKLYFGKIGINAANRIKEILGINVINYNISLKSDSINHIIKKHSGDREYLRGQIPVTKEDFNLIPEIIFAFDSIKISNNTKDDKPVLTFIKEIGNIYYLVENISDKSHCLEVLTMWKIKVRKKNSATTDNAINNPIQTSETSSGTSSFYQK